MAQGRPSRDKIDEAPLLPDYHLLIVLNLSTSVIVEALVHFLVS